MRNLAQEIQTLKAEIERLTECVAFTESMLNRENSDSDPDHKARGERLAQGELDCLYLSMVQFANQAQTQAQQGGENA